MSSGDQTLIINKNVQKCNYIYITINIKGDSCLVLFVVSLCICLVGF